MDGGILLGDVAFTDRFSLDQLLRLGTVERPFGLARFLFHRCQSCSGHLAQWRRDVADGSGKIDEYDRRLRKKIFNIWLRWLITGLV
jgi:hypothetical protein